MVHVGLLVHCSRVRIMVHKLCVLVRLLGISSVRIGEGGWTVVAGMLFLPLAHFARIGRLLTMMIWTNVPFGGWGRVVFCLFNAFFKDICWILVWLGGCR